MSSKQNMENKIRYDTFMAKLLPLFSRYSTEYAEGTMLVQLRAGIAAKGNTSEMRKYYSKWTTEELALLNSAVSHVVDGGIALGSRVSSDKVVALAAKFVEDGLAKLHGSEGPKPSERPKAPQQVATIKVQGRLGASMRQQLAVRLNSSIIAAMKRSTDPSAMLGFGKLYSKDDATVNALTGVLSDYIRKNVVSIVSGEYKLEPQASEYWARYIPKGLDPMEKEAASIVLDPPYWAGSVLQLDGVAEALGENAALGLFKSIASEVRKLEFEETLLEGWKASRPTFWEFANAASSDYITFNFKDIKGPEAEKAKHAIWVSRMAGFRALDVHFTGRQTFEPAITSGVPTGFKKLDFGFLNDIDPSRLKLFNDSFPFLATGKPDPASIEYGIRPEGQGLFELAIAECKYPVGQDRERKFDHNNFVAKFSGDLAPILSLTPLRVKQKGLNDIAYIHRLHNLALNTPSQPTVPGVVLSDTTKDGFKPRFSHNWMAEHRVSPQSLEFIGISPYMHANEMEALKLTEENLPEFIQALAAPEVRNNLVDKTIKDMILAPVEAIGIQKEIFRIFKELNPEQAKQVFEAAVADNKDKPADFADVNGRFDAFEVAFKVISANQVKALAKISARYQIEEETHGFTPMGAADALNWKGHKADSKIGPHSDASDPKGWFILDDHLKDMTKDGLSIRTIQMSGVYSVVDNDLKEKVLSRDGRSEVLGAKSLGNLLVYPHALVECEQHSKTDSAKKKYVAPFGSCNPPMPIPVQAKVTDHNREFLTRLNEHKLDDIDHALARLREYEKGVDVEFYAKELENKGFDPARAKGLGKEIFKASTNSALYDAFDDNNAVIELTEGQKKAYKMFQSYKELLEAEDKAFISKLDISQSDGDILTAYSDLPKRENKLFLCSPGVWLPVKSWANFKPAEKEDFLAMTGASNVNGKKSPLNANVDYAVVPSWLRLVDFGNRKTIITYDSDSQHKIGVAHSITATAQAFQDAFAGAKIAYRLIEPPDKDLKLGADDFIVRYGDAPFWDGCEVAEIAPNVSYKELNSKGAASGSLIRYLVTKQAQLKEELGSDRDNFTLGGF